MMFIKVQSTFNKKLRWCSVTRLPRSFTFRNGSELSWAVAGGWSGRWLHALLPLLVTNIPRIGIQFQETFNWGPFPSVVLHPCRFQSWCGGRASVRRWKETGLMGSRNGQCLQNKFSSGELLINSLKWVDQDGRGDLSCDSKRLWADGKSKVFVTWYLMKIEVDW